MVSQQDSLLQNPIFDALYCEEEDLRGGFVCEEAEIADFEEICKSPVSFLSEHDLFWEDDELVSLLSKEKNQAQSSGGGIDSSDGDFEMTRLEAIRWMLKVVARFEFTATTAVLAVNYYDRFTAGPCFHKDKPWMSHLVAVACLSIAAKVEETRVPLLLDLQVEESKYLFEAKTVQRGELLVLSTLRWKMNLVTPISFFDHIVRRFNLISNPYPEFLRNCESLILAIITDFRLVHFLPSVIAAATMMYAIRELEPRLAMEYENRLMTVLRTSKDEVDECQKLIVELMDGHKRRQLYRKRRLESVPRSPNGVVDAYFSSDSSNDSWEAASSGSSSPESSFKRSRYQDEHLGLAPSSRNWVLL